MNQLHEYISKHGCYWLKCLIDKMRQFN